MFNTKNNLTTLIVGIGVIIVLLVLGVLIVLEKDPTAYVGSLGAIVTIIVTNGLLSKRVDVVSKNVNGNTTKLQDENGLLREALVKALSTPEHRADVMPELMSEDTLQRITDDKDRLPSH